METTEIKIDGMHCDGCVRNITGVLLGLPGVRQADVVLAEARATVVFEPAEIERATLINAIEDAGFDAV